MTDGVLGLATEFSLQPLIEQGACDGCGRCVLVCPVAALRVDQGKAHVVHGDCDYCGECEAACPTGAISCPFDVVWSDDKREQNE